MIWVSSKNCKSKKNHMVFPRTTCATCRAMFVLNHGVFFQDVGGKKVLMVGLCIGDPSIYSANSCPAPWMKNVFFFWKKRGERSIFCGWFICGGKERLIFFLTSSLTTFFLTNGERSIFCGYLTLVKTTG